MKKQISVLEYELPVTITPLDEGGFLARCEELQGCMAEEKTIEKALETIIDVAKNLIDIRLKEKLTIPLKMKKKVTGKSIFHVLIPLIHQTSYA